MWEVGWRCGSGLGAGGSGCKFWHHLESAAWPQGPCGVLIVVIINDHNLYWWTSTTVTFIDDHQRSPSILMIINWNLQVDPRNHSAKCGPPPSSPCHALQLIRLCCKKLWSWRWWLDKVGTKYVFLVQCVLLLSCMSYSCEFRHTLWFITSETYPEE